MNVLSPEERNIRVSWHSTALALKRGISSDCDVPKLCESLREESRNLLLHSSVGVSDGDCGVLFGGVITCGGVDVRGYGYAVKLVGYGVNVDFSGNVLGYSVPVDESPSV